MTFAVIIERTAANYSAYVPDLPGCVATGATRDDVEREIAAAIALHLEGLREDGGQLPVPDCVVTTVEVRPPA